MRIPAIALSLALALPAAAQNTSGPCARTCMEAIGEQYLAAMVAHDPKQAPFAPGARYAENGVMLLLPDGLWRTVGSLRDYRLFVTDPVSGNIGFFSVVEENGAPALLSTRLLIQNRQITEAEATVARPAPGGGGLGPEPGNLERPRPQFLQTLAPAERRPREAMIDIANSYFSALENNDGTRHPPFADDCHRLENGFATTNRPVADGQRPSGMNMGCTEGFSLGFYREDTRLRDRRFLAIDEERGLVFAQIFFDHDATVRQYTLADGTPRTATRTAPWTWMIAEIFQIENGMISQVEAILLSVPYGMRPAFDSGVRRLSPTEQAEIARARGG